jgi:hypothetical protein
LPRGWGAIAGLKFFFWVPIKYRGHANHGFVEDFAGGQANENEGNE